MPVRRGGPGRARYTKAAGYLAIAFGAVHLVAAPWDRRDRFVQYAAQGWWDTFTLDEPTTQAEAERAHLFWVTLGSFGAPVLALGGHVLWSARQGHRVPGWLGVGLLAWGLPLVTGLPRSPGWTIPLIGGLIVAGDSDRRRGPAVSPPG